jgi:hypothetical protein
MGVRRSCITPDNMRPMVVKRSDCSRSLRRCSAAMARPAWAATTLSVLTSLSVKAPPSFLLINSMAPMVPVERARTGTTTTERALDPAAGACPERSFRHTGSPVLTTLPTTPSPS